MRTEAVSVKHGFRSKGRAMGIWERSKNFNNLRLILFEFPSRNRVKRFQRPERRK